SVDLRDHEPIGKLDLGPAQGLRCKLVEAMQRVYSDDHLAHQHMMGENRIIPDRADDWRGIRDPARLQHDPVYVLARDAPIGDPAQEGNETIEAGATSATARQDGQAGRTAEHHLVDWRFGDLV